MPDTIMTGHFAAKPLPLPRRLLTGAQMRDLWSAYAAARDGYSEDDEARTGAAYTEAQQRLLKARTADPEGVALKLSALAETGGGNVTALKETIEDLYQARRAPSLVEFCKAISVAAAPHTEEGGGIKCKAGLVNALIPLIGHYTIADAVGAIALLHTAYTALGGDSGDDPMFATLMLLEDFACGADASDADSAAARAHLIEKSQNTDDGWDLGPDNMAAATRQARHDLRCMRKGTFETSLFGGTFEEFFTRQGRLGDDLPVAAE